MGGQHETVSDADQSNYGIPDYWGNCTSIQMAHMVTNSSVAASRQVYCCCVYLVAGALSSLP